MANITFTIPDKVYERMRDLTVHRTDEEVQAMLQSWFNWISDLPQGFSLDLDGQIEAFLDEHYYENGYTKSS